MGGSARVLVVDDLDEMRTLIRRALSGCGYAVDVAATLAEARGLRPHEYDAVLVDAHLGAERGLDLVDELRSEDPAAVRRCLVITGGATEALPAGISCLTKPFQPHELIQAVRSLGNPAPESIPGGPAVIPQRSGADPRPEVPPSEQHPADAGTDARTGAATDTGPGAGQDAGPNAWRLLGLARAVRMRERQELVDFLHDNPIQELTAAGIELELMSRSMAPGQAQCVEALLQRLNAASGSLRWLIDGSWPFAEPENQLEAALKQRTRWLLAAPATVHTEGQAADLAAIDVPVIVDAVELMLLAMEPAGRPARAAVAVLVQERLIRVELTLGSIAADGPPVGDAASVQAALDALAAALGCTGHATLGAQYWRAVLVLRRQSSSDGRRAPDATARSPGLRR